MSLKSLHEFRDPVLSNNNARGRTPEGAKARRTLFSRNPPPIESWIRRHLFRYPSCVKVNRLPFPGRLICRCVMIFHRQQQALYEGQTSVISSHRLEEKNMLGFLALVLIVLWLLGFLAFHVSSGLIHVLLVVGVIMLLFHFLRGSPRTV
jgi:hypothetical protein